MKRNKKTEKQKEFMHLQEELYANWEAQRNLGYKPLEKPIHNGYNAFWVLRDDVSRRDDAHRFQYILDTYGTTVWCRRKDFKYWSYQHKKNVDINPGFREITPHVYEGLNSWVKKFFEPYTVYSRWGSNSYVMYRVNIPEYFFVRKRVKAYNTHYKVIDEILLQEEAEIKAIIENQFFDEQRRHWNRHSSGKWWRKCLNRKDRAHNKSALRRNMRVIFAKNDDINDDWGSWVDTWCDDQYEFKYRHKHYGKWWID